MNRRTKPIALLHEILKYDPETGFLTWKVNRGSRGKAGERAGCLSISDGYRHVTINWVKLFEHRVIFAMVYGYWPDLEIDHKNLTRDDNRIDNLRLATDSQNQANSKMQENNTTGFKGVSGHLGKFEANISINGKKKYLGRYDTAEEASAVYQAKALEIHGEFYRF